MTERAPHNDPFAELERMLNSDPAFVRDIADLNDQIDGMAERAEVVQTYPGLFDPTRPYYEEDIASVGHDIHAEFLRLCAVHGVQLGATDIPPALLDNIDHDLALYVYRLKDMIWSENTIAARGALAVDVPDGIEQSVGVSVVSGGDTLVGSMVAPVIGLMPDDVHAITQGQSGGAVFGVGLLLEKPTIVNEAGEVSRPFDTERVVLVLGTMGLVLHKIVYRAAE